MLAGLAAFVFTVVLDVVVFVVVTAVLPFVFVVVVVVVFDVFLGAFVAVFVLLSPGQAAPNKPNVKTAERAITFFISIKFSCLLQRMYIYFIV
jgi:hypothetical protein